MALVLALVLSLLQLGSGQWQVIGLDRPARVLVGEDVLFSCFLSPETNAETMEVRFFKNKLYAVVHQYRDGKDQEHMKMPDYRGRTVFFKDFLAKGQVSLRLQKVTPLDAGLYGCWFRSQTYEQEAIWELQVLEMGSAPLISIKGFVDGGIQLLCQSSGWFPQPTVKWKGRTALPSDSKVNADGHGLFDVETSLIIQESSGSVSCSIQHSDQSLEVESRVWIKGKILAEVRELTENLDYESRDGQAEWREARKYAVEVTLDMDTAHPQLYISDMKAISFRSHPQEVPYSEKRFKRKCVVASQGFRQGKYYWEVDVGYHKSWYVGVCQDDVERKVCMNLCPTNGYWVFGQWGHQQYFTFDPSKFSVFLRTPPTRVGIFLDYEDGAISFFNINDQSLIYKMTHQFEGVLRPFFAIYEGETRNPMYICPVSLR
ncbi:butyrophilin-like protein 8 isoform X2 [Nycticebus coucang]|uniref:butyrophilin-like protein 8 isoform X2 n=1 Tax=Nycticebus coucang TaxID=9470 RepID=UPI00234CCAD2|nr:butyrophilin-like protein 8 isoform X2 [Nycticebus coucang]